MPKAKAGHLEIAIPSALSRTSLTPPEGVSAFGNVGTGPTPPPHVAWACQIFSFLDKATRTAPAARSASYLTPYARDFAQWIDQFCEFFGPLTVQVRPFSLLVDGEIVFQDEALDGVAARLYNDGIVAITWSPGTTQEEALVLLQVLLSAPIDDDEPDLVVQLWQAGFVHITLDLYERGPTPPVEISLEREQIVEALHEQSQRESNYVVNFRGLTYKDNDQPVTPNTNPPRSFAQTPLPKADRRAIQSRLANEEASLALRSSEFFLLMLTQLKDQRDIGQLERWLLPVSEALLASEEFDALSFLIDDLLRLGESMQPALAVAYQDLQTRLLHQLSEPTHLTAIMKILAAPQLLSAQRMRGLQAFYIALSATLGEQLSTRLSSISGDAEALFSSVLGGGV